ncbi:MAG: hypothetical protein IPK07_08860 [Deltaproteobacteria bacterium]|nr:hypothetical protein [Deltaproteobacteria bacterium]
MPAPDARAPSDSPAPASEPLGAARPTIPIAVRAAPSSRAATVLAWMALGIAWLLPMVWIGRPVVDLDESIALHYASVPLTELPGALASDGVGPPLWPLVTHAGYALGGVTGARLVAALVLAVGATLAFRLTKRLFGSPAAAAMALLLAGSPAWLRASGHAGDPLAPWLTESLAGLVLAESVAARRVRGLRAFLLAVLLGTLTGATEPRVTALLLAQLVMVIPLTRHGSARWALLPTALGYLVGGLAAATLLALPNGPEGGLTSWPQWGLGPNVLAADPRSALGSFPTTVEALLTVVSLAVAVAGWVAPGSSQWQARGLGLGGLVMPFLAGSLLAATGLVRLDPRFLLSASAAATILAGRGLGYPIRQRIAAPAARVALTAALATALMLPVAVPRLTARLGLGDPPYRALAHALDTLVRPHDVVILDAPSAWVLPWYWPRAAASPDELPLGGRCWCSRAVGRSPSDGECSLLRRLDREHWLVWDGWPVPCASPRSQIELDPVDGHSGLADLLALPVRKWLVTARPARSPSDALEPWRRLLRNASQASRLELRLRTDGGTIDVARIDARYVGDGARLTVETSEHPWVPGTPFVPTIWSVFTTRPVPFAVRPTGPMSFVPSNLWLEGANDAIPAVAGVEPLEWRLYLSGQHRIALGPPGSGAGLELTPLLEGTETVPILTTPRGRTRIERSFGRSGQLWVELELREASEEPVTVDLLDRSSGRKASLTVPPGERRWSPALGYLMELEPGAHELEVTLAEGVAERLERAGHSTSPLAAVSIRLN